MIRGIIIAVAVLLMVFSGGAVSHAAAPPKAVEATPADFPVLNEGDTYTFKKRNVTVVHRIAAVNEDGSFEVEITYPDANKTETAKFDRNFSNAGSILFHRECSYYIDFPLSVGKKWEHRVDKRRDYGSGGGPQVEVYKYNVRSYETVDTEMGKVGAYRIEAFIVGGGGALKIWYSPEYRYIVKEDTDRTANYIKFSSRSLDLAKYEPGPPPGMASARSNAGRARAKAAQRDSGPAPLDIIETGADNGEAIAIVIGNRNYQGDIPAVEYAINDAAKVRELLIKGLGYREGNVVYLENATKSQIEAIFGLASTYKGKLYNYIKKGKSDVFVYYSGHGAPDVNSKQGYIVPSDADPQSIAITGYPLDLLYSNLAKISSELEVPNMTVVLDSCFSGASEGGMLIKNASPIFIETSNPLMSIRNAVIITSSSGSEVSSWYPQAKHSMFTYFFVSALNDGLASEQKNLTAGDVFTKLSDETSGIPYFARRLHGRTQTPQIFGDKGRVLVKE